MAYQRVRERRSKVLPGTCVDKVPWQADAREDLPVPVQPMSADICQELASRARYERNHIRCSRASVEPRPIPDSPSVKIVRYFLPPRLRPATLTTTQTYSAQVASVLPALLSAIRINPPSDGPPHDGKVLGKDLVTYTYNQPVAIPSYLIAIAAGDLRYRAFTKPAGKTWNSGIWTEPSLLDAAFWEFSEDTTRRVTHAKRKIRR